MIKYICKNCNNLICETSVCPVCKERAYINKIGNAFYFIIILHNFAQNQGFVQKGIGVKYKNSDSSPTQ